MDNVLSMGGQIAAIVICLFLLIFVVITVAFNLVMAFGLTWLREKTNLIKLLRPSVESVNKTSESALQGVSPSASENSIVRNAASVPLRVRSIDEKVEQASGRVVNTVVEFRARAVQAQTVVKAFLLPGLRGREQRKLGDGRISKPEMSYYREVTGVQSQELHSDDAVKTVAAKQRENVAPR